MPIPPACPRCRAAFDVPDRLAGKLIRCTTCREEFRVKGRPDDDYDRPRRPAVDRSAVNLTIIIVTIVVGLCVVAAVGVGIWVVLRKVNTGPAPPVAVQPDLPGPAGPGPGRPGGGVRADFTFHPQYRVPEAPAGPVTVTLSNPRKVAGTIPDRPTYQVDYQFVGGGPGPRDWHYLVARVPRGVCEVNLHGLSAGNGTLSFGFFPGHTPDGPFEVWIDRRTTAPAVTRQRVSAPLAVN
jgi:hypothetical protein